MYAPWNSNIKIEVAKKIMGEFLDSLKTIPKFRISAALLRTSNFY
jgi:hypothetical protein